MNPYAFDAIGSVLLIVAFFSIGGGCIGLAFSDARRMIRHRAEAKAAWERLKARAASGQAGCRAAQRKMREATHAGLMKAVGR